MPDIAFRRIFNFRTGADGGPHLGIAIQVKSLVSFGFSRARIADGDISDENSTTWRKNYLRVE
jgi:hypothetical protein